MKKSKLIKAKSYKLKATRRGQAMLLTVILLSTAILGATALVALLMTYQIRNSADTEASSQAIFAADAGVECALYYQGESNREDLCGTTDAPVELGNGATYRVRFVEIPPWYAQSVGQSGRTARSIQVLLDD